ncbi:MAG: CcmD family protein [Desulfovibrio sp.]|nr:CcmD family protein [Desulfovibrio sp.]
MDAAWVLYAGAIAWAGIGLYLFRLSRRQAALSLRIRRMEEEAENGA